MSDKSKIEWCDSTVNFWSGCTKVSAGCANCYAETRDKRHMIEAVDHWGKCAPRLKHVGAVKQAMAMNRAYMVCNDCGGGAREGVDCECGQIGAIGKWHRRRIFSLSLGDWLDEEVKIEWRAEMLHTVYRCGDCVWILCTKRTENFFRLLREILDCQSATGSLPYDVGFFNWLSQWVNDGHPPIHVILLASVENQAMADKRIPELLRIPAACRGLSLEPLLGPVDLGFHVTEKMKFLVPKLDWLIIGGESGPGARPCNVDWILSLVAQGKAAGVATFVKQLGAVPLLRPCSQHHFDWKYKTANAKRPENKMFSEFQINNQTMWRVLLADKKGGEINEFPHDSSLRVREFPEAAR